MLEKDNGYSICTINYKENRRLGTKWRRGAPVGEKSGNIDKSWGISSDKHRRIEKQLRGVDKVKSEDNEKIIAS